MLITAENRIQGLLRPLRDFPVLFKAIEFSRTFQENPLNSSTFQACGNPVDCQIKLTIVFNAIHFGLSIVQRVHRLSFLNHISNPEGLFLS